MTINRMKLVLTAAALAFMAGSRRWQFRPRPAPITTALPTPSPPRSRQVPRSIRRSPSTPPLSRLETLWMGAAQAMPADKYNFAPSAAIFAPGQKVQYDGVRTFAQIVTHTIQANYSMFATIGGIKPDVDVKAIGDLKSKDDIVKALAATFAFAHKAVANVTPANAFLSVRGMQTPASMLAAGVGHAEDEYGQAVEYLRMNAIIPPASETKPKM